MLQKIRRYAAHRRELKDLDTALSGGRQVSPPELVEASPTKAVWAVKVPGLADRFMSASGTMVDEERYVVRVDTEAFYRAWLRSSTPTGSVLPSDCELRANMPMDRKYRYAVDGFNEGRSNPVPLATVSAWLKGDQVQIEFTNGITRSFWLIANRAESFPVKVDNAEEAKLLNRVAGLDAAPQSFQDLFAAAKQQPAPRASDAPRQAPRPQPTQPIVARASNSGPRRGRSR